MINQSKSKDASGRGAAVVVYGLFLGSIMAVVTAPMGVLVAYAYRGRSADWVRTHLDYQAVTFWWAVAGLVIAGIAWWLLGSLDMGAQSAWWLGYLVFTAELAWLVGRCAVGLNRLMANEPVA